MVIEEEKGGIMTKTTMTKGLHLFTIVALTAGLALSVAPVPVVQADGVGHTYAPRGSVPRAAGAPDHGSGLSIGQTNVAPLEGLGTDAVTLPLRQDFGKPSLAALDMPAQAKPRRRASRPKTGPPSRNVCARPSTISPGTSRAWPT